MKNSLRVKAFSILMLLLISMTTAAYLGRSSSIQLKQTTEFQAASEDPLRVAIECANNSLARDNSTYDPVYFMRDLFESSGYETAIVNGTDIDTVEELNNYDVVVLGDSGWADNDFSIFQPALKEWVKNGGGLIATGWTLYGIASAGITGGDLDEILPVSPSYGAETSGNITMISENNPIAQGVDTFPIYDYAEFPSSEAADSGATVLGVTTANNDPVVVVWCYGLGKTVYLGPIYFGDFQSYDNEGLYTDANAVGLLLNSVEWAGKHVGPKCLILSNNGADTCALDFALKIPDVDFAWMAVSSETPTYSKLSGYDVVLLFEDGLFYNAPNVGSTVYDYVMSGGNLVIGTFYEQDRSDCISYAPNSWGTLETIDPFTSDGYGCAYSADELNVSSIVAHPITSGVQNLWCDSYQGGVHAKADTVVVANWTGLNALGETCPLAGYRIIEDNQRVVQISICPNYAYYNSSDNVEGDFYPLWANAIKWASEALYTGPQILEELTQISTGNQEENPSIALDHNGNLHIVWVGNNTANLYYMMVDNKGNVLINETCLDPSPNATTGHVKRPSIGVDSSNNVHIVFHAQNIYEPWPDYTNRTTLDSQEVIYLKINPYLDDMNGSSANYLDITLIPETIISTRDNTKSRAPNLAVDSEDNVHVVWFDNETTSIQGELHYLVMNSEGGIIVPETNVASGFYTDVDWGEPEIVVDSHNNAHVFFVTEGWNGSTYSWRDIWYTMIDGSTGIVLINSTQLTNSSETWKYARPFVDIDSEDKIHIVWHDSRFKDNGTGAEEIFYMEIDPYLDDRSGNSADPAIIKVVDEMLVSENDYVKSYLANIAVDKHGLSNIVWINEWASPYTDLYYAMIDPVGNKLVPEQRITHENGTLNFAAWGSNADRGPQLAVANGRIFIVDMAQDINSGYDNIWLTIAFADKSSPTTSINYTAYAHEGKDWLSAGSDISLLAIDEESNVTATYYKIDDGSWQIYGQPFNLSGLDDGVHTIQYYSTDYFGNEEDVKNQTVYLDATAPKIYTPIRYPTGDIQYNQAVTISVNIDDSGCGVKEAILHYSLNNGTTWTNVTMNYNSTNGLYEGTIPGQSSDMTIRYAISASDNIDNNAVQDNSGTYYIISVIPEFTSMIVLATFMLLTLMVTILMKKRGKKVIR
jgi:hypothetical protein